MLEDLASLTILGSGTEVLASQKAKSVLVCGVRVLESSAVWV